MLTLSCPTTSLACITQEDAYKAAMAVAENDEDRAATGTPTTTAKKRRKAGKKRK